MAVNSFLRIEIASLEGRAQSTRFRQNVLHSLHSALQSSEKLIKDAIRADTGHTDAEVTLEYVLTISELSKVYCDLSLEDELKNRRSTDNLSATTSLGIIYIIPSKQNLFYSAVSAVSAALAAGNCVVLELPATLMKVYRILSKTLSFALDADVFTLSSTRPSQEFLSKCSILDQTDKDVSTARAVAIIDRTANVPQAASTVGSACISFTGNSNYSPDVILVNEYVADDFITNLVRAVTSKKNGEISQIHSNVNSNSHSSLLKEIENNEGCKLIMSGSAGSVVEITDRTKAPPGLKLDKRLIIVCRITSLDDAIDICNGFKSPLEASFVFAADPEANYLSRFVDARISFINHIPIELLVGPFAPKHPTIAPTASPRFSAAHFRSPRPRVGQVSHLTSIYNERIHTGRSTALDAWVKSVVNLPLPSTGQGDGKATGFFDQAMLAVGAVAVSLIGSSMFALFWYQRRRT